MLSAIISAGYAGGTNSPSDMRDWVSAAEASKILHIRAERLVNAVAKQLVGRQYASGFGHRHTMIHRDTVANIVQDRQRFINKTAARDVRRAIIKLSELRTIFVVQI